MLALREIGEDFLLHRGESRGAGDESFVPCFEAQQCFVGGQCGFRARTHFSSAMRMVMVDTTQKFRPTEKTHVGLPWSKLNT